MRAGATGAGCDARVGRSRRRGGEGLHADRELGGRRREARLPPEALDPAIGPDEDVLREVEREIRILGESVGDRIDEVLVALDQIVEGLAIACLGGPHLLEIDLLGVSVFLGISLRHLPSPGGLTVWAGTYSL